MSVINPFNPTGDRDPVPGEVLSSYRYEPQFPGNNISNTNWVTHFTPNIQIGNADHEVSIHGNLTYIISTTSTSRYMSAVFKISTNGGDYVNLFQAIQNKGATEAGNNWFSVPVSYRHRPGVGIHKYRIQMTQSGTLAHLFEGKGVGTQVIVDVVYAPGSVYRVDSTQSWTVQADVPT